MPSHQIMQIAESLYNRGIISYPRTETEIFNETMDLKSLVQVQMSSPEWGQFAAKLLHNDGFEWPRSGSRNDQAHPPIHPVRALSKSELNDDEWKVYKSVCTHFLAACSADAKGETTDVDIHMGEELFHKSGLVVTDPCFLEVYREFDNWERRNDSFPAVFEEGESIPASGLELNQGRTTAPNLLTETELISLMDKHQIGTDATMHEHIRTVQTRQYVERVPPSSFRPTVLGTALYVGISRACPELTSPQLRANTERSIAAIADGTLNPMDCTQDIIRSYVASYERLGASLIDIENCLSQWLNVRTN
ncbi:DNA topoisomerase [Gregarina niphandrodes]|uniref:DNA topoisomerase n=1 Tax=Gregarina niphandrodes TaxID=110365 RepID=A0A023BA69_GRENI|nr:DNA topoisomerase [Gregarina niphandrodes]EZG77689.1 DNA topoisomerase [Gregarina niphandrodes]|eukprot:XP_011129488.1 DNA topoisomerase [Gregarina niphandrodes]